MNDDFVAAHCGPSASVGAHLLYEDPALGFQILAHILDRDYAGGPHDHGDSWAIYGQAVKHTDMSEWKRTDDGSVSGKATIETTKTIAWSPAGPEFFKTAPCTPSFIRRARVSSALPERILRTSCAAATTAR